MEAVVIAVIASAAFCSIYTFILPAWDAFAARRKSKDASAAQLTARTTASPAKRSPVSVRSNSAHSAT